MRINNAFLMMELIYTRTKVANVNVIAVIKKKMIQLST